ncbi:hypothetical protein H6P81_009757 [Aristolochia fimbriata]|uniref:Uncharacterized protein n=1 Tax=Aristolochia fimbriata TaxID=158543 RepID=A0AAV7EQ02_ARIFI|nr:hypothetical protein H6P81_009757 [Aristolochia fimbriata]
MVLLLFNLAQSPDCEADIKTVRYLVLNLTQSPGLAWSPGGYELLFLVTTLIRSSGCRQMAFRYRARMNLVVIVVSMARSPDLYLVSHPTWLPECVTWYLDVETGLVAGLGVSSLTRRCGR